MIGAFKQALRQFMGKESRTRPPQPPAQPPRRTELDDVQRVCDRYPDIGSLAFNLSMRSPDNEVEPTLNGRSFGPNARASFSFKCKNVECVGGGFDLQEVVDQMVAGKQSETSGRRVCQGWESAQLVNQRRCLYELNFRIVAIRNDES